MPIWVGGSGPQGVAFLLVQQWYVAESLAVRICRLFLPRPSKERNGMGRT